MEMTEALGGGVFNAAQVFPQPGAGAGVDLADLTMGFSAALEAGVHPSWGAQRRSAGPTELGRVAEEEEEEAAEEAAAAAAL